MFYFTGLKYYTIARVNYFVFFFLSRNLSVLWVYSRFTIILYYTIVFTLLYGVSSTDSLRAGRYVRFVFTVFNPTTSAVTRKRRRNRRSIEIHTHECLCYARALGTTIIRCGRTITWRFRVLHR